MKRMSIAAAVLIVLGGHGGIGGTKAHAEELLADQRSFLLWQFGVSGFQLATATVKVP